MRPSGCLAIGMHRRASSATIRRRTCRLASAQARSAVQQVITGKLLPALGAYSTDWQATAFASLGQASRSLAARAGVPRTRARAAQRATGPHRLLWRRLAPLAGKDLAAAVQRAVQAYEREQGALGLPAMQEVDALAAKVDRVLAAPGGALLLAARLCFTELVVYQSVTNDVTHRAGMMQQQVVRLVCSTHGMAMVTPRMGRAYALKHFANDIKVLLL